MNSVKGYYSTKNSKIINPFDLGTDFSAPGLF